MSSEPNDPAPTGGLVAGKYELLTMIGRGGMGSVWEGRHVSLGNRVAIKFIESEYANSGEARARFDNEARAAATLHSKHAIQIHDHGVTDDGRPYIVMELLEGEPLDKRVRRLGRMPLEDAARIILQVCRALSRAHDKGIIHRDLKPENIFLVKTPDDDDEVAKVLDFGIAKFKDPQGLGLSSSTKTGAVLGTPYFMSPEQARGLRSIDHRTDLWSLGIIVYKCVIGELPFDGESVGDLLVKICVSPVPVPSSIVPELPASFDAWFAKALEREPDKRFQTSQELADALAKCAGIAPRRTTGGASHGSQHGQHGGAISTGPITTPEPGAVTPSGAPRPTQAMPYTPMTPLDVRAESGSGLSGTQAPFVASAPPMHGPRTGLLLAAVAALAVGAAGAFFGLRNLKHDSGQTPTPPASNALGTIAPTPIDPLGPLSPTPAVAVDAGPLAALSPPTQARVNPPTNPVANTVKLPGTGPITLPSIVSVPVPVVVTAPQTAPITTPPTTTPVVVHPQTQVPAPVPVPVPHDTRPSQPPVPQWNRPATAPVPVPVRKPVPTPVPAPVPTPPKPPKPTQEPGF